MSRFTEAMAGGNEALLEALGDDHAYWPAGVEVDAITVSVIWTDAGVMEQAGVHSGKEELALAEAQVPVSAVAVPKIRHDKIIHGGVQWVVAEVLESVGGMHRLRMMRSKPTVAR